MVWRFRPDLIVAGDVFGNTIAVNVRQYPVEVEQTIVASVGDHLLKLGIEPVGR